MDDKLFMLDSQNRVEYFLNNLEYYSHHSDYEKKIVEVWVSGEYGQFSIEKWRPAFYLADKEKLYKAGDTLPERDEYLAYRGTVDDSKEDLLSDQSWTLDENKAIWFATTQQRLFQDGVLAGFVQLENPTVYSHVFIKEDILFYTNSRNESEIVIKEDKLPRYQGITKKHYPKDNNPLLSPPNKNMVEAMRAGKEFSDIFDTLGRSGMEIKEAFDLASKCYDLIKTGKCMTLDEALKKVK